MWKKPIDIGHVRPILCQINGKSQNKNLSSEAQNVDIAPRYKRVPKVGWFRRRGVRLQYPTHDPAYLRKLGTDLNLQERLDKMFAKEHSETAAKSVDIGFPPKKTCKSFLSLSLLFTFMKVLAASRELKD